MRGEKMTIQEASDRYKIPMEILREYESWGLCGAVKKVMGAWQYDDEDIQRLSTIMSLHDVGFSNDEVETYMRLLLEGENTEQERLEIIRRRRDSTLDEIHFRQAQLDRLDYLQYKIQRPEENQMKSEAYRDEKNSFSCMDAHNGIYPCRLRKQRLWGEHFPESVFRAGELCRIRREHPLF